MTNRLTNQSRYDTMKQRGNKMNINELEHLSAELFTFELYESGFWSALNLSYEDSLDVHNLIRAIKEHGIGYCDATRLTVRPRDNQYAIMCEVDGDKLWFHMNKEWFEQ